MTFSSVPKMITCKMFELFRVLCFPHMLCFFPSMRKPQNPACRLCIYFGGQAQKLEVVTYVVKLVTATYLQGLSG